MTIREGGFPRATPAQMPGFHAADAVTVQGSNLGAAAAPVMGQTTPPAAAPGYRAPEPQAPSIGRIVHYTLSQSDADIINGKRIRADASSTGNTAYAGQTFPMMITSSNNSLYGNPVPHDAYVNGQVFLDGNDVYWATSVKIGLPGEPRAFVWPDRSW